ncbi:unnamed protein product [Phaedon cochleariae]|uniref:Poly [ADP-ribose] polymerase n=1 Tax=Phaedon cochleariae TaxID=80249 RepID=A0A9P0DLC7_PHACE|nr:unnamed protein product [Phaedon cochleariae]
MEKVVEQVELVESVSRKELKEFSPVEIEKNSSIVRGLFFYSKALYHWNHTDYDTPYTMVELESYSSEKSDILEDFKKNSSAKVHKIMRVQNPFLQLQYELKLKQKEELNTGIKETQVYHGTKECNVTSICQKNFDWRKLGASGYRSSKFGQGVSFSSSSSYASDYPRRHYDDPRVMFLASIMEVSRCEGDDGMVIPPLPHDTSADLMHDNVVVKYFDNEFYPAYIIYYTPK